MPKCNYFRIENVKGNFMGRHVIKTFLLTTALLANAQNILAADAAKLSPAVEKVLGYLKEHKEKHKLQDPVQQLSTELEERDGARIHVRLHQVHEGVMVRGTL